MRSAMPSLASLTWFASQLITPQNLGDPATVNEENFTRFIQDLGDWIQYHPYSPRIQQEYRLINPNHGNEPATIAIENVINILNIAVNPCHHQTIKNFIDALLSDCSQGNISYATVTLFGAL